MREVRREGDPRSALREHRHVLAGGFDVVDGRQRGAGQRAVQAAVDVELHRRAVERRAVLELDAVAEVHRPLRVVGVVLDALDEVGHGLAVLVVGEQRVADRAQHGQAARRGRHPVWRPRVGRVGLEAVDERAALDRVRWIRRCPLARRDGGRGRSGGGRGRSGGGGGRSGGRRRTIRCSASSIAAAADPRGGGVWWRCRRRRRMMRRRGARSPRARRAPSSCAVSGARFPLCVGPTVRSRRVGATSKGPNVARCVGLRRAVPVHVINSSSGPTPVRDVTASSARSPSLRTRGRPRPRAQTRAGAAPSRSAT